MSQLSDGSNANWPTGKLWTTMISCQNRPCASLIQMNSGAPLLTRSAWMPARCCSHQTTIAKSSAPSHGLPHVLRCHGLHQANCTLSGLLVWAKGLTIVELQVDLGSRSCNVAAGLGEWVPEGTCPDSRVYPRLHALFMDDPWNVQRAPAALQLSCASNARNTHPPMPALWRPERQWIKADSPAYIVLRSKGHTSSKSRVLDPAWATHKCFKRASVSTTPPLDEGASAMHAIWRVTPFGKRCAVPRVGIPLSHSLPPALFW